MSKSGWATPSEGKPEGARPYHLKNGRMWAPHFPTKTRSGNGFGNEDMLDHRNVIYQMLMHCPPFINWLENFMMVHQNKSLPKQPVTPGRIEDIVCDRRGEECYYCVLWAIYALYWTEEPPKDPWFMEQELPDDHHISMSEELWDRMSSVWDPEEQEDPAKFWPVFWGLLHEQIEEKHERSLAQLNRIFGLSMLTKGVCKGRHACSEPHYTSHEELMLHVRVPLRTKRIQSENQTSLRVAIERFFKSKRHVKCATCNNDQEQTEVMECPPEVLLVQLNRMDLNGDEPKKVLDRVKLVEKLEFNVEHFDPRLNLPPDSARVHYELFWVAMHQGESLKEGHYYCYAKGRKEWSLLDDEQSWPADGFESFARTKESEEEGYIFGYRRYIPGHQQPQPAVLYNPDGTAEDGMDLDTPESKTNEEQEDEEALDLSHWTSQDFQKAKRLMITFTDVDGSFSRSVDLVGCAIDPLRRRAMNQIGFPSDTTGILELTLLDRDNNIVESCSIDGYLKDEGTEKRRPDHTRARILAEQKRNGRGNSTYSAPFARYDEEFPKRYHDTPPGMIKFGDPFNLRPFDVKDLILSHRFKLAEAQQKEQKEKEEKEKKEKDEEKNKEEAETGKSLISSLKPKDAGVKKNGKDKTKKDKKPKKKNKKKNEEKNESKDGDCKPETE
ncbi:Peptidase C19 ubiquitin carboxyl-terminal hydrolase 2 [Penicillium malachiteum]|uniref:Peptidase C19 ubiquitin carboxyl-terminal hydrolase 2 n=1 Tax=Penicillium malachiteum TaxID=1324776 RepID=A0AAD6HUC3_9EURO|nr:Peptidase C19 ubiquitin carboxyl-terminal hydrolase 2 [Penicillium malachiteum]